MDCGGSRRRRCPTSGRFGRQQDSRANLDVGRSAGHRCHCPIRPLPISVRRYFRRYFSNNSSARFSTIANEFCRGARWTPHRLLHIDTTVSIGGRKADALVAFAGFAYTDASRRNDRRALALLVSGRNTHYIRSFRARSFQGRFLREKFRRRDPGTTPLQE